MHESTGEKIWPLCVSYSRENTLGTNELAWKWGCDSVFSWTSVSWRVCVCCDSLMVSVSRLRLGWVTRSPLLITLPSWKARRGQTHGMWLCSRTWTCIPNRILDLATDLPISLAQLSCATTHENLMTSSVFQLGEDARFDIGCSSSFSSSIHFTGDKYNRGLYTKTLCTGMCAWGHKYKVNCVQCCHLGRQKNILCTQSTCSQYLYRKLIPHRKTRWKHVHINLIML